MCGDQDVFAMYSRAAQSRIAALGNMPPIPYSLLDIDSRDALTPLQHRFISPHIPRPPRPSLLFSRKCPAPYHSGF